MDFLDPKKQRAHTIRLIAGYVLIGLAILIATLILLYQAYGFGLGKNGQVVQNGFVFVASQPGNAQVYVNNKLFKNTTNTRLQLPEGNYSLDVKKTDYHSWHRDVSVQGGLVYRYDYPLLVPNTLVTTAVKTYPNQPTLATTSPDRHWLVVQQPEAALNFDVIDISDPKQVAAKVTTVSLPAAIMTSAVASDGTWKLAEWSNDSRHVVLEHDYADGSEYILLDTQDAAKSLNLTKTLGLTSGQVLSLIDKKYDKYYVYDAAAKTVDSASISAASKMSPVLTGVLAFKSYSDDMMLYATEAGASSGQVMTMLKDGDVTYKIREVGAGGPFLLNLVQYDGNWFVAVGSSPDNKVYVFRNPQSVRRAGKVKNLVPVQILRADAPNYLEFSANTRFLALESGTSFAVYDAEYDEGYNYTSPLPLDADQPHATWMDGVRLSYISNGKVVFFDYDGTNAQTLSPASPAYLPFFDRDYHNLYTLTAPSAGSSASALTATSLLIPKDQ